MTWGRSQVSRSMKASASERQRRTRTPRSAGSESPCRRHASQPATPRRAARRAGSGSRWARGSRGSGRAGGARRGPGRCRTRRWASRSAGSASAGRTIDSPAGTRAMTTLRKLPTTAPDERTGPGERHPAERSPGGRSPGLRRAPAPPARLRAPSSRRTKKSSSVSRWGVSDTSRRPPAHDRAHRRVGRRPRRRRRRSSRSPVARRRAWPRASALARRRRARPRSARRARTRGGEQVADAPHVAQLAAEDHAHAVAERLHVGEDVGREEDGLARGACSSRMRSRTSLRPMGSSPLIGSSSTTKAGSPTSAWAMPSRCCMPFEYLRICRSAASASPTSSSSSSQRAPRSAARHAGERARRSASASRAGEELVEGGVLGQVADARASASRRDGRVEDEGACPRVGKMSPISILMVVVLPAPFGPTKPKISPSCDREVEVLHRRRRACGAAPTSKVLVSPSVRRIMRVGHACRDDAVAAGRVSKAPAPRRHAALTENVSRRGPGCRCSSPGHAGTGTPGLREVGDPRAWHRPCYVLGAKTGARASASPTSAGASRLASDITWTERP